MFDVTFNLRRQKPSQLPGHTGIHADLRLIKHNKSLTKERVSRSEYQQTLQDLIHGMDAFTS
jgi:hypothetical protein